MDTYATLADLSVTIERVSTRQHILERPRFTRVTTEVVLAGSGNEGAGEDVTYSASDQERCPADIATLDLAGSWTIDSLSAHLDTLDLHPQGIDAGESQAPYRRWAIESAALDLALAQAGTTLFTATGTEPAPVTFCLSMSLPAADAQLVHDWLAARPGTRFKLDLSKDWTPALMAELAATSAVDVIDIKGHYRGDWIDNTPDPELYAAVVAAFPDAWIEDAWIDDETRDALAPARGRLSWDAPIHSLADYTGLEWTPGAVNIKPSRFGSLRELLATIDRCRADGIPLYGGGQFELGRGRTQIQHVASAWYPHAANDVAPSIFHTARPGDAVPASPLAIPAPAGFGFAA